MRYRLDFVELHSGVAYVETVSEADAIAAWNTDAVDYVDGRPDGNVHLVRVSEAPL